MTLPYPRLWGMPPELYETKFLPITTAQVAAGDGVEGQSYRISDGVDEGVRLAFVSTANNTTASFRYWDFIQTEYVESLWPGIPAATATQLGTIAGVPTASITLDAGSGNVVSAARFTIAPPTDTIGAQRLLVSTAETFSMAMNTARIVPVRDLGEAAATLHAIGISDSTTYTSSVYCIGSTETDLSDAIAEDARIEWLSSVVTEFELTLQQGATTRTAILSVVGRVAV